MAIYRTKLIFIQTYTHNFNCLNSNLHSVVLMVRDSVNQLKISLWLFLISKY